MTGIRYQRPLQRALSIFVPALAVFGAACGGTSLNEAPSDTSASAGAGREPHGGGASGSAGAEVGGSIGTSGGSDAAGSAGAGAGNAGAGGTGGAGAGGAGGSGASAGSAGAFGGTGGDSGSAGMGLAGNAGVCHAAPPVVCGGGTIALPKTCVAADLAVVGKSLPIGTCQIMCESMFTSSCAISAVDATSITVMCMTGCPTGNE